MGDSYVTATHPALNSVCCYTLGGKPPCLKKTQVIAFFAPYSSFRTPDHVMGRVKLLEQFVFAWYYRISCAFVLF